MPTLVLDLAVFLAATCVAEIDLQPQATECRVMWEVLERRAHRRDPGKDSRERLYEMTHEFAAYWDPRTRDRRAWIAQLDREGRLLLGRRLARWERYVSAADSWLAGHTTLCPDAWSFGGTPGDGKHADDEPPCVGARRVVCLPVTERQAYWDTRTCRPKSGSRTGGQP